MAVCAHQFGENALHFLCQYADLPLAWRVTARRFSFIPFKTDPANLFQLFEDAGQRLQPVARVEQFYLGTPAPDDVLPGADTQKVNFGLNYYLPHNLRVSGSYGRQFSSLGNSNIWNVGVTSVIVAVTVASVGP